MVPRMSGKQRGYAFDVDAWIQFHLLRLASFHPETTKADIAVLAEIIQRYHGKFGNGWASHNHLGAMAGVHKASVIRAKRNLERLGFITVLQAGRRGSATVYKPNFARVPKKGSTHATETDGLGSRDETEITEYGSTCATPSYLPDRPTRAESQIDRHDPAPASPPAAAGLGATAPGGAGGFEEIFHAYYGGKKGHAGSKAKARAVLRALEPSRELQARILASATEWYEAWAVQGNPDAARMHLSTWLENEDYDCKPPAAFKPKERKAKAQPKPEAANDNVPADDDTIPDFMVGSPQLWPIGEYCGEFIENSIDEQGKDVSADLLFEVNTPGEHFGTKFRHRFFVDCFVQSLQKEGQKYLDDICGAVGVPSVEDLDDLMFRPLRVRADGRKLTYTKIQEAA